MTGKQLKNSILQLAIQGKLVPQDPHDEPASELLKRIRKEKEQLVKTGKLKKKDLESTPIAEDEKPFEIPETWEWCRLKDILFLLTDGTHSTPKYVEEGIPFVSVKNMSSGQLIIENTKYITKEEHEELIKRCNPEKGDILLSKVGTTGVPALIDTKEPFSIFVSIALLKFPKDKINAYYLINLINSSLVQEQAKLNTRGVGNKNWVIKDIENTIITLPPLSEQHRIVEKIEELMPLVEEYDKAQSELDKLNESLPEQLKKSILQQAIMGKLVPQDPNDEPASELLKRIHKEKENLVKSGALKKKDLITTPISDDEKPFDIPESWEWVHLGEVGLFERGSGIKRDETFDAGLPCVRYGEMYTRYRYVSTFDKTVSFTSKDVFDKCRKAHKGDLFMALTGENKEDIALAAQYVGDEEIAVGGDLCHFSILEAFALYFVYLINSPYFIEQKRVLATGDIIVHISADKLGSVPVPLPPLSEQHRIVAKIEELFNILK